MFLRFCYRLGCKLGCKSLNLHPFLRYKLNRVHLLFHKFVGVVDVSLTYKPFRAVAHP